VPPFALYPGHDMPARLDRDRAARAGGDRHRPRDIEEQKLGAVRDNRGASASSSGTRVAEPQIGDQHLLRPFCLEKVGRFVDVRADVEPDGANQETEDVGNAPAPIDQLLVGELRRQGHAELRDGPYAGPLPARAEAAALTTVLGQKDDYATEPTARRKPLQHRRGRY